VHKHLRRLERVWLEHPIYFVTTCTFRKKPILASKGVAEILIEEWHSARDRHGWSVGRYVIMPDHVHFFCSAVHHAKQLSGFMRAWKQWTSKRIKTEQNFTRALWQEEFFDHVLRSTESYSQKWEYLSENPVRAGLIASAGDWQWQGEIELLTVRDAAL
jgi:putative transposase